MLRKKHIAQAEINIIVPDEVVGQAEITRYCGTQILRLEITANSLSNPRLHLSDCREVEE